MYNSSNNNNRKGRHDRPKSARTGADNSTEMKEVDVNEIDDLDDLDYLDDLDADKADSDDTDEIKDKAEDEAKNKTNVYLHVDRKDDDCVEIDLLSIASFMGKRKKLYAYVFAVAILVGVLVGLGVSLVNYIGGESYAQAMISFNYDGIDEGLDPNGAAFDISKVKSASVIDNALTSLGIEDFTTEDIRENIEIVGVIPDDAVERITVIKEMSLEDVSNYEKILDVSYYPTQYIVYLYKASGMTGAQATQILDAVLSSYREYFMDTYANAEALTVTTNLIDYTDYDYTEAADLLETQLSIMQSYVEELSDEAPDFRASSTGLSFGDISTALDTVESVNLVNLASYIESHNLTKDKDRLAEYYEYKIKQYNLELSEYQVQLSNVQTTINNYQKDQVVIVSSQEAVQETTQTSEYYDSLLSQKLSISAKIASINTDLNETYALLESLNSATTSSEQEEYDYADTTLASLAETISNWVDLTTETADEYYSTTLFSNAYKITVPAQYSAVDGGLFAIVKKVGICVAGAVFIVLLVWCVDGLRLEMKRTRKREEEV